MTEYLGYDSEGEWWVVDALGRALRPATLAERQALPIVAIGKGVRR